VLGRANLGPPCSECAPAESEYLIFAVGWRTTVGRGTLWPCAAAVPFLPFSLSPSVGWRSQPLAAAEADAPRSPTSIPEPGGIDVGVAASKKRPGPASLRALALVSGAAAGTLDNTKHSLPYSRSAEVS
jgi:hypothetical protein